MKLHYALLAGIVLSLAAGNSTQAASMTWGPCRLADTGTTTVSPGVDINAATP